MKQNKERNSKENVAKQDLQTEQNATKEQEGQANAAEECAGADNVSVELEEVKKKYAELNDSYLRLMAEYDNYRKRTLREKADLIKTGGESALKNLLPVVDDFERALKNIGTDENVKTLVEGVELIYNKFITYLAQQGVKPLDVVGKEFNTEDSEAIAIIPAPSEDMKGKVLECVQTGYKLHDKVIRHAKVVVGE